MSEEQKAAYGGPGWSPRMRPHREEIGSLWRACGVDREWTRLKAVLLHEPGAEVATVAEPDRVQWLEALDPERARSQHQELQTVYREAGVRLPLLRPAALYQTQRLLDLFAPK